MVNEKYVQFLRGAESPIVDEQHPILELSDEELQMVIGSKGQPPSPKTTGTASYDNSDSLGCCDGTKVCCI